MIVDDLTITQAPDGYCVVLTIENSLAAAPNLGEIALDGATIYVTRGFEAEPEYLVIAPSPGWTADPVELTLPDNASATVLLCPAMGV